MKLRTTAAGQITKQIGGFRAAAIEVVDMNHQDFAFQDDRGGAFVLLGDRKTLPTGEAKYRGHYE